MSDYDELARSAKVSPARIAQIVIVAQLAPAIQEYVLFLSTEHAGLITEPQLREIAREIRWDRQLIQFRHATLTNPEDTEAAITALPAHARTRVLNASS